MPYNDTFKAWYGPEAITVEQACETAFTTWLQATLNDMDGPYRSILGADVKLFKSGALASKAFKNNIPVVVVALGRGEKPTNSGRDIEGVFYRGLRRILSLNLDMGFASLLGPNDSAEKLVDDDNRLAGVVNNAVNGGQAALESLGLFNIRIKPDQESQSAANRRNPHRITFYAITLDNYTPPPAP